MGSRDTFMLWRVGSVAFKLFEAIDLWLCLLWPHGCQLVCWACHEYWQKCGCCLEKRSGWNLTNPTGDYGPDKWQKIDTNRVSTTQRSTNQLETLHRYYPFREFAVRWCRTNHCM